MDTTDAFYAATQTDDGPAPSHEYCAALTFEVWGLPESLVASARYHHRPESAPPPFQSLVSAVYLGDLLATERGLAFKLDSASSDESRQFALAALGLKADQVEAIGASLTERVEQLTQALTG